MMKEMKYRRSIFSILALTLLCACGKEIPVQPEAEVTRVIHYVASVQGGPDTKATVDDGKHYVFEAGDQLFITSGDNMYGNLILISGVGDNSAVFEGELNCVGGFEPTVSTPLSATLVSLSDKIHTISDGKITGTNYPTNEFASGFADAVSKYSDFTSSSTYGNRHFTLAQQSGFLVFSITFDETVAAGTNTTVTLKNGDATTLRSASLQTETVEGAVRLDFAAGFPSSFSFSEGAELTVSGTDINDHYTIAPTTVLSNKYYTFGRNLNLMDYFTLETIEASTSITFNYATASDYVQYSTDGGRNWTSYLTTNGAIFVADAGTKVSFRARRTGYNCNGMSAIVTADKPCYIYGNMMSLLCTDGFYTPATTLPSDNTFRAALKGATWARSHPTKKILLPATTLRNSCYWDLFNGCTGLTECPVNSLPAETLMTYSYYQMFLNCSSMTSVPTISATTLAQECCLGMFKGCSSLPVAPALPATTVGQGSYREMFSGCTSLVTVPAFTIAVINGNSCCYQMFYGCSSLENPNCTLSATTLDVSCYQGMFSGCSSLTTGPVFPNIITDAPGHSFREMFLGCSSLSCISATITAASSVDRAFQQMFDSCTNLTAPPTIYVNAVRQSTCWKMFYNCSSLKNPNCTLNATTMASSCYQEMFRGCSSLTSAPNLPATVLSSSCYKWMFAGCTSLETGPTLGTITDVAAEGCYLMFSGCTKLESVGGVSITTTSNVSRALQQMFDGCTNLTSVPEIYVNGVGESTCYKMFNQCSSLMAVSGSINITTAAKTVLDEMFAECTKLVSVPNITISAVGERACYRMFWHDAKLTATNITLSAETLAKECYCSMFDGCTVLPSAPALPATTLVNGCYKIMFWGCKDLKEAPDLPATTLAESCYELMFEQCSALSSIKCYATDISATNCTKNWMNAVKNDNTCTFYRPSSMTSWSSGASGIPTNWNIQDI